MSALRHERSFSAYQFLTRSQPLIRPRPHSECKLISIKIDQGKVAHAVIVVLRWLYDPGSARRQFGVDGIDLRTRRCRHCRIAGSFGLPKAGARQLRPDTGTHRMSEFRIRM